ncbi:MAG: magnesium chelatase subunit D [Ramlibacter sp.]
MNISQLPGLGADAAVAAALFAVDPAGLGGVALRAAAGPVRDQWLALLRQLLPAGTPQRRIPLNTTDASLLGGLDLAATLQCGRPVAQPGVLAQTDGGIALLAMAERVSAGVAARLAAVLDTQEVVAERDGLAIRQRARLGVVALDEGLDDDGQLPAALLDRMAFHLDLNTPAPAQDIPDWQPDEILQARALLAQVQASDAIVQALCATAQALGVASLRAPLLALRVARVAAALAGQDEVEQGHAEMAARLVLAPRATQLPAPPQQAEDQPEQDDTPEPPPPADDNAGDLPDETDKPEEPEERNEPTGGELQELLLAAAAAALPPGLLAALQAGEASRSRAQAAGRGGAAQKSRARGRPVGARRGEPRGGARLHVMETLRAAAPWQRLREQQALRAAAPASPCAGATRRIHVRREDFHIRRYKQLSQTTTVFVVDASGSSALHRLAEAKGAVELLLADCYVRRDRVAVLAFRGQTAETLLPPTRSLARAKRSLAALPGGGGTPLAAAIDAARALGALIQRTGETPVVVMLTDGRANIARDGAPGRARAHDDALAAARLFRQTGLTALLLDTSPQPQDSAQALAQAMGAAYVALPHAGAHTLSQAVRLAMPVPG